MSISNEFIYWSDVENKADQGVDFFTRLAKATLDESLPDDERKALEIAAQRFPEAYHLLKETLTPIGEKEPMRLRAIYQMLHSTIVASGTIGGQQS